LASTLAENSRDATQFIVFDVATGTVDISVRDTLEGVPAKTRQKGRALIPCTVFQGVLHTLPYFRNRSIEIGVSEGQMRIESMVFHNRTITLRDAVLDEQIA
jgi:hypothetical protein